MKTKFQSTFYGIVVLVFIAIVQTVCAQGTAFTYQGRLGSGGNAASGVYDFTFAVWNANSGGAQQGATFATNTLPVTNGYFVATLDFGNVFDGNARWLEIAVRTNGGAGFTVLSPRQPLTPAPYALYASNAGSAGVAALANSVAPGAVTGSAVADSQLVRSINGQTDHVTVPTNFWRLSGNGGTVGGTDFIGTTDNQPLELKVNGQRALRLEPGFTANLIGGSPENTIESGSVGSTIGGGGTTGGSPPGSNYIRGGYSTISGGYRNTLKGYTGFIGGGWGNTIDSNVSSVVIGGGAANRIESAGSVIAGGMGGVILVGASGSVIGGGTDNQILTTAYHSTIAGGAYNTIQSNAFISTIGGGDGNIIGSNAYASVIAGGFDNTIQDKAQGSVIGGGEQNLIQTNAYYSTVAGGRWNTNGAPFAVVLGGFQNAALGQSRVAAGQRAKALNNGTFVWADLQNADFISTAQNQFLIRAAGGVGINTNNPSGAALNVNGLVTATGFSGSGAALTGLTTASLADNSVTAAKLANDSSSLSKVTAGSMAVNGPNVGIGTSSPTDALDVEGDVRLNTHDLLFAQGADRFHGLGWYGGGKEFAGANVDGPVLYGFGGGGLGTTSGTTNLALRWTGSGNVGINKNNPATALDVNGTVTATALVVNGSITATNFIGGGAGLTGLSGSQVTSGTVSDSRLSANVARLNNAQSFTGAKTFRNPSDNGGSLRVGADALGGEPKFVYFGDSDYVRIGENATDDRMELRANQFSFLDGYIRLNDNKIFFRGGNDQFHGLGWFLSNSFGGSNPDGPVLFGNGGGSLGTVGATTNLALIWNSSGNVGIGAASPGQRLYVAGNIYATGTITPNSDRNLKTDFAVVDATAVLAQVAKLPIHQWRFKAEPKGVKHVGPMAQDFQSAFGLGEIPTAIATVDADGVALAAIQGLNQKLDEKDAEIQDLKQSIADLKKMVQSLAEKK
jgi:hypothetical protein